MVMFHITDTFVEFVVVSGSSVLHLRKLLHEEKCEAAMGSIISCLAAFHRWDTLV